MTVRLVNTDINAMDIGAACSRLKAKQKVCVYPIVFITMAGLSACSNQDGLDAAGK